MSNLHYRLSFTNYFAKFYSLVLKQWNKTKDFMMFVLRISLPKLKIAHRLQSSSSCEGVEVYTNFMDNTYRTQNIRNTESMQNESPTSTSL